MGRRAPRLRSAADRHPAALAGAEDRLRRAALDELREAGVLARLGKKHVRAGNGRRGAQADRSKRRVGGDLQKRGVPDGGELGVHDPERRGVGKRGYEEVHAGHRGGLGGLSWSEEAGARPRRQAERDVDSLLWEWRGASDIG